MAYVYQTFDKNGKAHPLYRYQYTDWMGHRRATTGYSSRAKTEQLAARTQFEHDEIRRGHRPPPKSWNRHAKRPFKEVADEYLAWGKSQGGRNGHPWGHDHLASRERHLRWWPEKLGLETLADLDAGLLPRVEEALRTLQNKGTKGKTLANYADSLRSFCNWCVERGYLAENPLKGMAPFNSAPELVRRALTVQEIKKLLAAAPEYRRVLYEVALCSGLRAGELRALEPDDLDMERGGIHLRAELTRNRKPGFQPLPAVLVERLKAFADGDAAPTLYRRFGAKRKGFPKNPLLYVPDKAARTLYADLKKAGLSKDGPGGRADFHALRVAYVSLVLEAGAGVKEAQSLARHGTPTLTMNTYGRARETRLGELAEAVGDAVLTAEKVAESTATAQRIAAGSEGYCPATAYDEQTMGSNPSPSAIENETGAGHKLSCAGLVSSKPFICQHAEECILRSRRPMCRHATERAGFGYGSRSLPLVVIHAPACATSAPITGNAC